MIHSNASRYRKVWRTRPRTFLRMLGEYGSRSPGILKYSLPNKEHRWDIASIFVKRTYTKYDFEHTCNVKFSKYKKSKDYGFFCFTDPGMEKKPNHKIIMGDCFIKQEDHDGPIFLT